MPVTEWGHLLQMATQQPHHLVFTSTQAVHVVANFEQEWRPLAIWCVGATTAEAASESFPEAEIKGGAVNAATLATEIIAEGVQQVVFCCGNQRLDTLPVMLRAAGATVHEVVVYHTLSIPQIIDGHFDAIVFYSPSGVESFFSNNNLPTGAVTFAIGATTAAAAHKYTQQVITPATPGKGALINEIINYYKQP
ncbi:MAG: uroporphyrinogen-III synthase [Chitinophagia bacterium]|nr:uroporphyrinogen-III synthase [Chitinophagia bacterium]